MMTTAAERIALREALANELERMAELIEAVPDDVFGRDRENAGSVGAHFRHMIEIAGILIEGIATGRVDYADRARDKRIETEPEVAASAALDIARKIGTIPMKSGNRRLNVRSEIDPEIYLASTVDREIEFVTSHTIHHLALVAEKLSAFGFQIDPEIGLAPATSRYRSKMAKASSGE